MKIKMYADVWPGHTPNLPVHATSHPQPLVQVQGLPLPKRLSFELDIPDDLITCAVEPIGNVKASELK